MVGRTRRDLRSRKPRCQVGSAEPALTRTGSSGSAKPCPTGAVWDAVLQGCACSDPYAYIKPNSTIGACACIDGYALYNGVCTRTECIPGLRSYNAETCGVDPSGGGLTTIGYVGGNVGSCPSTKSTINTCGCKVGSNGVCYQNKVVYYLCPTSPVISQNLCVTTL